MVRGEGLEKFIVRDNAEDNWTIRMLATTTHNTALFIKELRLFGTKLSLTNAPFLTQIEFHFSLVFFFLFFSFSLSLSHILNFL